MSKRFYLVAGEPSGDRHAAELAKALNQRAPGSVIKGVGGRHLRAAGQDQLFDLAEHAVVGLVDVLKNYRKFRQMFYDVLSDIQQCQPDAVVLVDFPGFNLRLAKQIRKRHPQVKLVYYIAPQVWAWKAGRAKTMEKLLDLLLVIFPFEETWFNQNVPALPTLWVGHPNLDAWNSSSMLPYQERENTLILLPGSRRKEIQYHLPVFVEALKQLHPQHPELEFLLLAPDDEKAAYIKEELKHFEELPHINVETNYHLTRLSHSRLAWVASGTATLECAMAGLPMLVIYKTQPLTWWVGKMLVKLPYLSMVNVVAEKKVVAEFLQADAVPVAFSEATCQLLNSPASLNKMHADLVRLTSELKSSRGASAQAAEAIFNL
ncbi:MAG: lipid-A-disaccharide synthase [Verrucomicrobiota bacterium]